MAKHGVSDSISDQELGTQHASSVLVLRNSGPVGRRFGSGYSCCGPRSACPGTGNLLNYDDLEDVNWGYTHNFPKSSKEEDENIRYPLGGSSNRMWTESPKRGSPDVIKRCETPAGGLAGSTGRSICGLVTPAFLVVP